MCDNIAVVEVLMFDIARDPIMPACARNILAAIFNINIIVSHTQGLNNTVGGLLSRWQHTSEDCQKLHDLVEAPIWIDDHLDCTLLNHDI